MNSFAQYIERLNTIKEESDVFVVDKDDRVDFKKAQDHLNSACAALEKKDLIGYKKAMNDHFKMLERIQSNVKKGIV